MIKESTVHSHIPAQKVRPLKAQGLLPDGSFAQDGDFRVDMYDSLGALGIYGLDKIDAEQFGYEDYKPKSYGMDAIQNNVTVPSTGTLVQHLQGWLPGAVATITAARTIDKITGIMTIGEFEDEQIVQQIVENTANPSPYSDFANTPLAGVNVNYVHRDVVRWEDGFNVGFLEEKVGSRGRLNTAAEKRKSVMQFGLEVVRNRIGFYGQNNGLNQTYGLLNDPGLPAYITVATGASSSSKLWSLKTFQEIINDIQQAVQALQTNSKGVIDPEEVSLTLAIPVNRYQYLNTTTDFGISVMDWIRKNYPKMRILAVPEFEGANGGSNIFYLFADSINDGSSTDGGQTFIQMVPAKLIVTGVARYEKHYVEGFANATAGVMCKRPYAVYRATGI